ncbi:MAG TPA: hypothetical protein VMH34_00040 [Gammaproteobacteria bacterium]|nr:hypothetical protein [Gammaproteobacteria bacterium]
MTDPLQAIRKGEFERDICVHIFSASSAMVGVCLTVIGLLRIVITIQNADTIADDLLALNALLFLTSCIISYWALRSRTRQRMYSLERVADVIFLSALGLMVIICGFITYAISIS